MDTERYNRQIILKGFGLNAQTKLAKAKVLVIGAGGLGCPALQYLAAAGVGKIGIADDDKIALSNLHRQILFTTANVGALKAEIAAEKLSALNPTIAITSISKRVNQENILHLLDDYQYIIDATDNFESRYLINDACALLHKPLIFAAVSGYEGQLAIFNVKDGNHQTTNYRDMFPVPPAKGEIPNCAENGVLGVLAGIIGTMQASETIKLITGIGEPLINKLLCYNMLNNQTYEVALAPVSGTYQHPQTAQQFLKMNAKNDSVHHANLYQEIDTHEMDELLKNGSTVLIDVRESFEFPLLNANKYQKIPISAFDDLLATNIEEANIVLICQHGIRSVAAAEALKEKYGPLKHIFSLKGGIARYRNYFTDHDER